MSVVSPSIEIDSLPNLVTNTSGNAGGTATCDTMKANGGYVQGIAFERTGHGLLWSTRGQTLRTSDGGRHWRPISATLPEVREAYSGWLVNDRVGYLPLQNDDRADWELLRTENGGRTWRLVRHWSRR